MAEEIKINAENALPVLQNPSPAIDSCSFCGVGHLAVAMFYMPGGCIANHDMIYQKLCLQHIKKSQPSKDMYLIEDYTWKKEFTSDWNKGLI